MRKLSVLCILAFPGLAAAQTTTANVAVPRLNGMRFADQFTGASVAAQINAAVADCGAYSGAAGNSCIVIIPSTLGCGEPNQTPDNVVLWDFRNCAQSQGLRFNLSAAVAGGVRSKMLLQDNFNATTIGLNPGNAAATFYVYSLVDSPDVTNNTIAAINGTQAINTQTANFTGVLVGVEGSAVANSTNGTPRTASDVRGGTFGATAGGNTSVTNLTSLQAQAPANTGTGTVTNAVSLIAEDPGLTGSTLSLAGLFRGKVEFDRSIGIGSSPIPFAALFINGQRPTGNSGASQFGIFVAETTDSGATTEGTGIKARADTAAAAYTQALNTGVHVATPVVGAGSTITQWNGVRIEAGPTAGSKFGIQQVGPGDTNQFAGPTKANGGVTVGLNGVLVTVHQHARVTTGSIGATTRREVLLTWPKTMTNTNYTVTCNVEDSTTPAGTQGLTFERIRTKSATQAGAVINNPTGGAITGTLDCSADHN
jgi:hypothetical protein